MSAAGSVQLRGHGWATWTLAAALLFLAFSKALDAGWAHGVLGLPRPWGRFVLTMAAVVEFSLGLLLFAIHPRPRWWVLVATSLWLIALLVLNAWVDLGSCRCAGRFGNLGRAGRFALLAALLLLAARGLWSRPELYDLDPARERLSNRWRRTGAGILVAAALAGLAAYLGEDAPGESMPGVGRVEIVTTEGPRLEGSASPTARAGPIRELGDAPSAQPRADLTLLGRVLASQSHQPVSGAIVWTPMTADSGASGPMRTRSGADGRFELKAPQRTLAEPSGAPKAGRRVHVLAKGYRPLRTDCEPGRESDILVDSGVAIDGVVVDEAGAPVAGAMIEAMGAMGDEVWQPEREERVPHALEEAPDYGWAMSDEAGVFHVGGLTERGAYRILVHAHGHAMPDVDPPAQGLTALGGSTIRIQLHSLYGFRLRFLDEETREPVHGVLMSWSGSLSWGSSVDATRRDRWDPASKGLLTDGEFTWARTHDTKMPCPPIQVVAKAAGYEATRVTITPAPFPGPRVDALLRPRHGARVVPLTLRASLANGTEFSGLLSVCVQRVEGGPYDLAVMRFRDGRGSEPLPVEVGEDRVRLWLQGAGDATESWIPASDTRSVGGDQAGPVEFTLSGACLRLRVLSPAGESLRGYQLYLQAGGITSTTEPWLAVQSEPDWLGADNSCSLWLPPGIATIEVSKEGFQRTMRSVEIPARGETLDTTVRLTK